MLYGQALENCISVGKFEVADARFVSLNLLEPRHARQNCPFKEIFHPHKTLSWCKMNDMAMYPPRYNYLVF